MTKEEAEKICKAYTTSVSCSENVSPDKEAWAKLWVDDKPRLAVVYGKAETPPFEAEEYIGKDCICRLIFGAGEKIKSLAFSNEHIYTLSDDHPSMFFWNFDLTIKLESGSPMCNRIICRITVQNGKIKEFVEFGDPRRRNELFARLG